MTPYTTRIAPSPTGDMHLGTARTAYFNWLAARATGGKFILRIDDTDQARNVDECVDDIFRVMKWLGLDYDEVVYQSKRLDAYRGIVHSMLDRGLAREDEGAIRFAPPPKMREGLTSWNDELAGEVKITDRDWDSIDGLVLMKSDGFPTYNFASMVDDATLGINFIIRGKDHTSNTSKQIPLFYAAGLIDPAGDFPKFAHLGLLFKSKKKLSKRDGVGSMVGLMEAGYDPDAVLNFMLRLGWGPTVDDKTTKILDRDRALELFLDGGKMKNSQANVDEAKLNSFDRKYKARKKKAAEAEA